MELLLYNGGSFCLNTDSDTKPFLRYHKFPDFQILRFSDLKNRIFASMRQIAVLILFFLLAQQTTVNGQQPVSESVSQYLIVTPNNDGIRRWADTLARFRNEQGIYTKVVSLKEIGENLPFTLRDYFEDYYKDNETRRQRDNKYKSAILLFGDYDKDPKKGITSFYVTNIHETDVKYLTDNRLADFDGDGLPEIVIARMPVADALQAELMVKKTINYERYPSENPDYYRRPVTAMGFQESRWFQLCSEIVAGYFENIGKEPQRYNSIYEGQPDSVWSTAENTDKIIKYFGPEGLDYIPSDIKHLTDWDAGHDDLCRAINEGTFLVQHRDHGDYQKWNNPFLSNDNINNLNNEHLTFVMSANCRTGHFGYGSGDDDCLAERLLRIENGAVAVIAASEISYSFVNDTYVWGFYDYLWNDFIPSYGDDNIDFKYPAFANAYGKQFLKQSSWPYISLHKDVTYDIMHYFGDAFLQLNTEMPEELEITHPEEISSDCKHFPIKKEKGSRVAFSVDGNIIATSFDDDTNIHITPQRYGTKIKVVATKQNHYRYEDYIEVKSRLDDEDTNIYPNPTKDIVNIEGIGIKRIVIYNTLGQKVKEINNSNYDELIRIDCNGFSKGIYHLQIIYEEKNVVRSLVKT